LTDDDPNQRNALADELLIALKRVLTPELHTRLSLAATPWPDNPPDSQDVGTDL
jgi:hypothetical protein